jgi:hypothetical protein
MYLYDHQRRVGRVEKVGRVYANGFAKINNGEIKFKFCDEEGVFFLEDQRNLIPSKCNL